MSRLNCYTLTRGRGLWVSGPSRAEVKSGVALVSGINVSAGDEVIVRGTRGLTFYAIEDGVSICVHLGSGASVRIVHEGYDVALDWINAIERLEAMNAKSIVVIGAPETGKSTLSLWIANRLKLGVIEGDVGQNEFGLPTCVSYAVHPDRKAFSLQDFPSPKCVFVGHVSAEKVVDLVISSIVIAGKALGSNYVVDTDGFIQGRGFSYKVALIKALEPDVVIHLGPDYAGLSKAIRRKGYDVLTVPAVPHPRERDRLDRRIYRSQQWARLFTKTRTITVSLDVVSGLCDYGIISEGVIVFDCPRRRLIVSRGRIPVSITGYKLRPGWERGIIAGLMIKRGEYILGLVERINITEEKVILRVPEDVGDIKPQDVMLGWVKLREKFVEEHLQVTLHPEASMVIGRLR